MTRGRTLDFAIVLASALVAIALGTWVAGYWGFAIDTLIYHDAWANNLYAAHPIIGQVPGFIYTPVAALAIYPIQFIPPAPFVFGYVVVSFAAYAWLLWPLAFRLRIILLGLAAWPVAIGNIDWLLALVVVFGFRRPYLYAVPLLTKLSTGAIGLVWFGVRGEGRKVAIIIAVAAGLSAASFVVRADLWAGWLVMLREQTAAFPGGYVYPFWLPQVSLLIRAGAGCLLVAIGALTGRAWTIPVAMVLAQGDLHPWNLGLLAAIPRLPVFARVAWVERRLRLRQATRTA